MYNASIPKIPLDAYANHDIFKIYAIDVGLLGAMANLSAKTLIHDNQLFQEFKGSFTENFIAQSLAEHQKNIYYWSSEGKAEVDYLWQHEDEIYPFEIKSGNTNKKKSLQVYNDKYNPKLLLRCSPMNLKLDGKILNCPLYLVSELKRLLSFVSD